MSEEEAEASIETSKETETEKVFNNACYYYVELRNGIQEFKDEYNKEVESLTKEQEKIMKEKQAIYEAKYKDKIEKFEGLKLKQEGMVIEQFPLDTKKVSFEYGSIGTRTITGILIENQEKLLDVLTKKDLLNKAVKTFDTAWLKKAMEMEVVTENNGIKSTEKVSLVFTPKKEV